MRNEFSQIHEAPEGWELVEYTYDGVPWLNIGRMAIYLVTFPALFIFARHFASSLF